MRRFFCFDILSNQGTWKRCLVIQFFVGFVCNLVYLSNVLYPSLGQWTYGAPRNTSRGRKKCGKRPKRLTLQPFLVPQEVSAVSVDSFPPSNSLIGVSPDAITESFPTFEDILPSLCPFLPPRDVSHSGSRLSLPRLHHHLSRRHGATIAWPLRSW